MGVLGCLIHWCRTSNENLFYILQQVFPTSCTTPNFAGKTLRIQLVEMDIKRYLQITYAA